MKLQPMTDFVLEQYPKFNPFGSDEDCRVFDKVFAYANFLKQPLELGMFVPVDEEGVVIDPECMYPSLEKALNLKLDEEYARAKEKVLFEGIELKSKTEDSWMFAINGKFPFIIRKNMIIEQLLIYSTKLEFTPSALKTIGL